MTIHDIARANAQHAHDETYNAYLREKREKAIAPIVAERDEALALVVERTAERDEAMVQAHEWQRRYEECVASHPGEPDPEPEPADFPMIFGAATTNNQAEFDVLDALWGPIRATREYDSGRGFLEVEDYSWHAFANRNFDYVVFSADQRDDYAATARGDHDALIQRMLDSLPDALPSTKGVICLGNEPNAGKGIDPATYRAALEHVIDTFGYEPVEGWIWGVAFSNFNVWGAGSTAGEAWLPRRTNGPFVVETHFYGKDTYASPADALGRTFLPAVRRRPLWRWGIGEISAQESARKGPWFAEVADYCAANGAAYFLLFDTGVGGSAPIATSEGTRRAVKAIAEKYAGNDWS